MGNDLKFNIPNTYNAQQFFRELTGHYSIKKARSINEKIVIFDTFDWRLFNKSLVLFQSGNKLFLRKLFENTIRQSAEINTLPVFAWDFPDSELKKELAPIIKIRALLKLAEVHIRTTPYGMLNPDEKTVVRLVYEKMRLSPDKDAPVLATHFWLKPVRGYAKDHQKIAKQFEKAGFAPNKKEDIYFKVLEVVGKKPGSYSAKLNIQLDPAMSSDEATKMILYFLLQVIRTNQTHIAKDLDTEFLHDFRVAIRRTRSALGQIKNVFPAETTRRFKKDFAFVGKLSNQLRDLDVYLLNEDPYKAVLPDILRDDIQPLFDYLRKKRSKAFQEVIRGLASKKYAKILQDWEAFLNEPRLDSPAASNTNLPIIDLARKRIYKKYQNIVKTGNLILENTADEKLHFLRIECKKLRYLMEFFSSLFTLQKVNTLIDQLKKLQDNLGDFNDLCIQVTYLLSMAEELPMTHQKSKKTLVAIGSLIGSLDREKQKIKDAFATTFTNFASPANKKLFGELFALKKKEIIS